MKSNTKNSKPLKPPPLLFVLLILVFAPSICEFSSLTYAERTNVACCSVCTVVISMEARLTVTRFVSRASEESEACTDTERRSCSLC